MGPGDGLVRRPDAEVRIGSRLDLRPQARGRPGPGTVGAGRRASHERRGYPALEALGRGTGLAASLGARWRRVSWRFRDPKPSIRR